MDTYEVERINEVKKALNDLKLEKEEIIEVEYFDPSWENYSLPPVTECYYFVYARLGSDPFFEALIVSNRKPEAAVVEKTRHRPGVEIPLKKICKIRRA